ncbi:hypothetical protein AB6C72_24570, partial [Vibrio splendidus]
SPKAAKTQQAAKSGAAVTSRETVKLKKATQTISSEKAMQTAKPMEPKYPTPVTQALTELKANPTRQTPSNEKLTSKE